MFGPNEQPPEPRPFKGFNLMAGIILAMVGVNDAYTDHEWWAAFNLIFALANIYAYYRP